MYSLSDEWRFIEVGQKEDLPEEPYRSSLRRDYARILHSASFRRLQGKTQLFPGDESDFFRNRLTHSLEVSQIAYDIAVRLNSTHPVFKDKKNKINPAICEIAGLIHDLGHPPFGHNGEKALDDCMKEHGGFEGNAQTLRIILKTEKKERIDDDGSFKLFDKDGNDLRAGLNLTARIIASGLKYDHLIQNLRSSEDNLQKGYYQSELNQIREIKKKIIESDSPPEPFKTIECSIMDVADDIAYSTYDLEDALKVGFLTPLDFLSANDDILEYIFEKCDKKYSIDDIKNEIAEIFGGIILPFIKEQQKIENDDPEFTEKSLKNFIDPYEASKKLSYDAHSGESCHLFRMKTATL